MHTSGHGRTWVWRHWSFQRPAQVMGILNATPDSFSDGDEHGDPCAAVQHGLAMARAGARWIDVGGESTRPGATPVSLSEELNRVLPVVRELAGQGVAVSIDTTKAEVAQACLEAGAQMVNDVTAGGDPAMAGVVARHGVPWVLMHCRGIPATMQQNPHYDDVVQEVGDHLAERLAQACAQGVNAAQVLVDPGIGFGKALAHNLTLLRALPALEARLQCPVVLGLSRKSVLPGILGRDVPMVERDAAGHLAHALLARHCALLRVHDVPGCVDALAMAAALDGEQSC